MNKVTLLIAAVLVATTTVLVAGIAVVPSTVQHAQANPCSNLVTATAGTSIAGDVNIKCKFTDDVEVDETP